MMTSPPSPHPHNCKQSSPPRLLGSAQYSPVAPGSASPYVLPSPVCSSATSDGHPKRSRSCRWCIFLLLITLILVTASTRCITHPPSLGLFHPVSSPGPSPSGHGWLPHRRHPAPASSPTAGKPESLPSATSSSAPSKATSASAASDSSPSEKQQLPLIPTSPPVLPAPFPQPLDNLTQNFSTVSCYNFFANMTESESFRSCRPLSLLLQSSSAFLQAQTNISLLNTLIWGTCNTTIIEDQCSINMVRFAFELRSACSTDLADHNAFATNTLLALNAFSLMRNVGCLAAPSSSSSTTTTPTANTYCYVEAAHDPNPADLYVYGLPLGLPIPSNTVSRCSACTGMIMQRYAAALEDPGRAGVLTGLKSTYNAAAAKAAEHCGAAYVQTNIALSTSAAVSAFGIQSARQASLLAVVLTVGLVIGVLN